MGIIYAFTKNKKAKVKAAGDTLSLLSLLVASGECLAERISQEKGVSLEEAESVVVDCIKDGIRNIKE